MPGEKKECTADGYPVISAIFPFSFFLNLFSPHLHLKAHCFTWHIIHLTYTTFISFLAFSSCKCINASSLPFLLIKYDWAYILTELLKRQFGCCCCVYYHHHQDHLDHLDHQAEKNKTQVWLLISARAATSSKRRRPISKRHKHTDTHTHCWANVNNYYKWWSHIRRQFALCFQPHQKDRQTDNRHQPISPYLSFHPPVSALSGPLGTICDHYPIWWWWQATHWNGNEKERSATLHLADFDAASSCQPWPFSSLLLLTHPFIHLCHHYIICITFLLEKTAQAEKRLSFKRRKRGKWQVCI